MIDKLCEGILYFFLLMLFVLFWADGLIIVIERMLKKKSNLPTYEISGAPEKIKTTVTMNGVDVTDDVNGKLFDLLLHNPSCNCAPDSSGICKSCTDLARDYFRNKQNEAI